MLTTEQAKEQHVKEILEQPVYTTESRVYKRLYARLLKLSESDLANLALLIALKRLPLPKPGEEDQ